MKKVNINKFLVFIFCTILLCFLITGCQNENTESESSVPEISESETSSKIEEEIKPLDVYLDGTKYGGIDISGMTYKEALELSKELSADYAEKLSSYTVTVKADEETSFVIKGSDITFTDKTESKLAELIVHDIDGEHDLAISFDSDKIKDILTEAFAEYNVEPKDTKITGISDGVITYESAVTGKLVNVDKTSEIILEQLLKLDSTDIVPEFDIIEPEFTDEMVSEYTCIGSYSTTIYTGQEESIYNMKLAMRILDGRVVAPGASLSFMNYMDYADAYGGWQAGNVIMNGILVPSSGGGICQASTTIYGAALDSGMAILDRDNHGIPSSYVKMGLDAMVSSGSSDFIFRNDYDYPIVLDTSYGSRTLYAKIYGIQPTEWDDIACDAWITGTEPATQGVRFIVDPGLKEGEFVLQNEAAQGYRTAAQRYFYKDGVLVKTENLTNSYYPPRQKTYTIGKGTDTTTLEDGTEKRSEGMIAPSPSPSESPSPSPEVTPSESPSTAPTPTVTPTPTPTATPTPTVTPTPTPTTTPEVTPTPTPETPSESPTSEPDVTVHPDGSDETAVG